MILLCPTYEDSKYNTMQKDFLTLILRELTGDISPDELMVLHDWLQQDPSNQQQYDEIESTWDYSANYTPKIKVDPMAAFRAQMAKINDEAKETPVYDLPSVKKEAKTPIFSIKRIASIAAIFAAVLGSVVIMRNMNQEAYRALEGVEYVKLSDGSSVWLEEGSTLTVDKFDAKQRTVSLNGKAHFDIERDEDRPFSISADDINVSVLGTAFTVDATIDDAIVAVSHGKVRVNTESNSSVILLKGQQVVESKNGLHTSNIDPSKVHTWTNEDLSFDNAPLTEVIADLGNHFNVNFVYKGKANLDACPFTSKSLANIELDDVLDILELTYSMKIEKKSDTEIVLRRIRCRR